MDCSLKQLAIFFSILPDLHWKHFALNRYGFLFPLEMLVLAALL